MSLFKMDADQYFLHYLTIRKQILFPLKIRIFLDMLSNSTFKPTSLFFNAQPHQENLQNMMGLLDLSKLQKSYCLYKFAVYLKHGGDGDEQLETIQNEDEIITNKNFIVHGYLMQEVMGIKNWKQVKLQYSFIKNVINVEIKKKHYRISLDKSIVRKSNKHKNTIIFQQFDGASIKNEKMYFTFEEHLFHQIYSQLFLKSITSKIAKFLQSDQMPQKGEHNSEAQLNFIISHKSIKNFTSNRSNFLHKIMGTKFNFTPIFVTKNCTISTSKFFPKYSKMQCHFDCEAEFLKKVFLIKFQNANYKYLMHTQELQNFANKYFAIYAKHSIPQKKGDNFGMEHVFLQQFSNTNLEQFLFIQSVKEWSQGMIDSLLFKIREKMKGSSLVLYAKFNIDTLIKGQQIQISQKNEIFSETVLIPFLLEFYEMIIRNDNRKECDINEYLGEQLGRNRRDISLKQKQKNEEDNEDGTTCQQNSEGSERQEPAEISPQIKKDIPYMAEN